MHNKQKLLVKLLSAAIHNTKPERSFMKRLNLNVLFAEAKAHQVDALLYTTLKKMGALQSSDNSMLLPGNKPMWPFRRKRNYVVSQWEKCAVLKGIIQIQHMNRINKVLKVFSQEGIPVIVLKGLVLRSFYPCPELRTMADADILLHRKDIEQAKKLLLEMGYTAKESSPIHIHFVHASYLPIELHWRLINNQYIKGTACFEPFIWESALPIQLGDAHALMLSWEDQVLHLCLHMAVHMLYSGFGLRQLCDLALLIENKGEIINWNTLHEKVKAFGIERFTSSIFMVCKELFGMEIPHSANLKNTVDTYYHKLLISEIFAGGVFGKRSLARIYSLDLLDHSICKGKNPGYSGLKYFISLIFPSSKSLSGKYAYARKIPVLIPAAWFHHCLSGIHNKNLSLSKKILFFFSTISISRKRSKLLQWLDLQ